MTLFDSEPPDVPDVGARVEPVTAKGRPTRSRSAKEPAAKAPPAKSLPAKESTAPSEEAAPATTVRLRLGVSYDGTGFRGFAAQQGQRTVAGELATAIATVVRHRVELTCAGRTDAGVHALGQVVHVDVRPEVDMARLAKGVNAMLGPAIVVQSVSVAPAGFDARHSARARSYRYLVLEAPTPDPLLAHVSWHVRGPLDRRAMAAGADALIGEHDFRAFCRRARGPRRRTPSCARSSMPASSR